MTSSPHPRSTTFVVRTSARAAGVRIRELLPRQADIAAMARQPRRNLMAGLIVAIVALPLALAFGVASGLGAQAGLATAVVAGIAAAVFGGSNLQVSGPTGAMTVVLVPVVAAHGASGVLMVGAMAGLILMAMSIAGLGSYVRFLPVSVIEGFTAGIAVVIALQQIPAALGYIDTTGDTVWANVADAARQYSHQPLAAPLVVSLAVMALMLIGARWRPGIPFSLVGVILATVLTKVLDLPLTSIDSLPASLPAPSLDFVDLGATGTLLMSALAVAALAALESLLSATVADGMSEGEHHDPDRELFGQGVANLVAPVFGGVPATAAIARTAVNVRAGASSRLAAVSHSVVLLVVISAAAPLVSDIPLAALAGVLFATCVRMIDVESIRALMRSTRGDAVVVVFTFGVTVVFDLVTAVGVGVGVAVIFALRAMARSARLDQVPLEIDDHSPEELDLLSEHIAAYRVDGPLFFAAAHRLVLELSDIITAKVVIVRMSRTSTVDATGAQMLGDAITKLERRGVTVMLAGVTAEHHHVLKTLGVTEKLHSEGLVFADTPAAITHARRLIMPSDHHATGHSGLADAASPQGSRSR